MSASSLLASTESAIEALLSGKVQSYTMPDGASVTKLDLAKLMAARDTLRRQALAEQPSARSVYRPVSLGRA